MRLQRIDGGVRVLRGPIKLDFLLCQRVRDVVPDQRIGRQADGLLIGRHSLFRLLGRDVGLAQRHFQQRILGRDVDRLFQLRNGFRKLLLVHIQRAQVGVRILIEGIDFDLLLELFDRLVIALLPLISPAQVVIGKAIVSVVCNLRLEGGDGFIGLAQRHVSVA